MGLASLCFSLSEDVPCCMRMSGLGKSLGRREWNGGQI